MYDYKYIVVKWICTVWRGLWIYSEDSCQSQNRGPLSVHVSTSKGLTLARYSAYVFYSRFALPTVLGQSSPPLKRYSTVNTVCTELWTGRGWKEGRETGRAKGQRVRDEFYLNTGGFCFDFLSAVLLSSHSPPVWVQESVFGTFDATCSPYCILPAAPSPVLAPLICFMTLWRCKAEGSLTLGCSSRGGWKDVEDYFLKTFLNTLGLV